MATDVHARLDSFDRAVGGIATDHGGILRCTTCGKELPVQSRYWREGWPTCCNGHTMRWITARQIAAGEW